MLRPTRKPIVALPDPLPHEAFVFRRPCVAFVSGLSGLLLLAGGVHTAAAETWSLQNKVDFTAPASPEFLATGDFNGDGRLDFVTANYGGQNLSVWLGTGTGAFGARTDLPLGTGPSTVAVGDVNGDGRLDIVAANYPEASITVFLGTGTGDFGARTDYPAAAAPICLALADFNADGRLDVVITSASYANVAVLLGTGGGHFGAKTDFAISGTSYGVATGDLNGDGRIDIVATCYSPNTVSVLLGNGSGGFAPRTDIATGAGPNAVALGDLNGDGKLDLVTGNSVPTASVMLGNGAGGFGARTDYLTPGYATSVAIGDMNGDGKADVALAIFATNAISVFAGTGTGLLNIRVDVPTGSSAYSVAIGDANGDGVSDLLVANVGANTVTVVSSAGAALFATPVTSVAGTSPYSIAIGDLNRDGFPDVVCPNYAGGSVSVFDNTATGTLRPRRDFAVGLGPEAVVIGDFNGDSRPDLMCLNHGAGTVSFLAGDGAGGFAAKVDLIVGATGDRLRMGDINGDGVLDIATFSPSAFSQVTRSYGNGAGGIMTTSIYSGLGSYITDIVLPDLNADGRLDLVTANSGSSSISVLLGTGGGALGGPTDYAVLAQPAGLGVADMNGDGKLDLVVTYAAGSTASTLLGSGTGTFAPRTDWNAGNHSGALDLADIDGDGRTDLVIAGSSITAALGNGAGGLTWMTSFGAPGGGSMAIADLNGDGLPELASSVFGTNSIQISTHLSRTRTTLSVSPSPGVSGGLITCTAGVSATTPTSATPGGTVRFFDGTTLLGTGQLSNGSAAFASFAPYAGARSISAVYVGDAKFVGSSSNPAAEFVAANPSPLIASIADIANDQGRQARVRFRGSAFDYNGSPTPIQHYDVYRQVQPGLAARQVNPGMWAAAAGVTPPARIELLNWDFVATLTARADTGYSVVVPTLADSNASGLHRATFMVSAVTATPSVYFDSPADSGYTTDNLPPIAPAPFTGAYTAGATHLHWSPNLETDLAGYRVYRGSSSGFTPSFANLVASPPDTGFVDAGPSGRWYKLSAVDVNGNQGAFAVLGPNGTLAVDEAGSLAFALEPVQPNPSRGGALSIAFALPSGAPARLELLDVSGRRVGLRDAGALGAGRHTLELQEARLLPPGLYLVRLVQGATSRVTRVAITR